MSANFQPVITANYGKKGAQAILFCEFWLTVVLMIYINKFYYEMIFSGQYWLLILLPIEIYGLLWQFAGISFLISWFIYTILKKIEPPKEGIFPIKGREFNMYCYRFWIAYYSLYMMRAMPLPWADMFVFRAFGSKIGGNVVLYDSWIDFELVDVHDYVMMSLNAAVYSHCIYHDKFLVKRVVVKKNAIVGAESVVAPGTIFEEGAVLGAGCGTHIDQVLDAYMIHVGSPANKKLPIKIIDNEVNKVPSESSEVSEEK